MNKIKKDLRNTKEIMMKQKVTERKNQNKKESKKDRNKETRKKQGKDEEKRSNKYKKIKGTKVLARKMHFFLLLSSWHFNLCFLFFLFFI